MTDQELSELRAEAIRKRDFAHEMLRRFSVTERVWLREGATATELIPVRERKQDWEIDYSIWALRAVDLASVDYALVYREPVLGEIVVEQRFSTMESALDALAEYDSTYHALHIARVDQRWNVVSVEYPVAGGEELITE